MASPSEAPAMIAINRVKAGQEEAFETFTKDVMAPAVQRARPHLADWWQVWKPAREQPEDVAGPAYVFAFYGRASLDDWDLESVFTEAHGEEAGPQLMRQFHGFLNGDQEVYMFS